ncbi:EamA family transporter [Kitasatospora purpeofusca]|uniref:EamA family transporter n=1 Tax=Kitasatospora purpeofusca TaxID=67352 RepID=UPI002257F8D4|nr:EamA family transporter [Kitasatospora purpeofusca]MCX4755928.1 EamA family transporter [Kitasatospora purpeofusca]WSR36221.1 EamA family transporter [Kitasatospora purpeofusca]
MEASFRWVLLTAVAPVAWGANYYVTREFLPADRPLWGAALRALPAGLLLLALRPRRPRGAWWWRTAVLGLLNTAGFFVLLYIASQSLATSVASTVMAASPLAMLLLAWVLTAARPARAHLLGALAGLAGVALMLLTRSEPVSLPGLAASAAAMLVSSLGYVLATRWREGADVLATTGWQLLAGGLVLLPLASVFEGGPAVPAGRELAAFGYVAVVATALAFAAWFTGLRRLPAGTVGLLGLLNPLTGVLLGTVVAGERLGPPQFAGLLLVLAGVALGRPRGGAGGGSGGAPEGVVEGVSEGRPGGGPLGRVAAAGVAGGGGGGAGDGGGSGGRSVRDAPE